MVSKVVPVCPICKKRTEWKVHDNWGWAGLKGYKISCSLCEAEWEWNYKITAGLFLTPTLESNRQFAKVTENDSIWILRKSGGSQEAQSLLNRELNLLYWKKRAGSFCGKCGSLLSPSEKFCPECGSRREANA
jgi:NADH pyrophosphatase NudC (nudix superfamily)